MMYKETVWNHCIRNEKKCGFSYSFISETGALEVLDYNNKREYILPVR